MPQAVFLNFCVILCPDAADTLLFLILFQANAPMPQLFFLSNGCSVIVGMAPSWYALQDASEDLRADREVVLEAVQKEGPARGRS